MKQVTLATVVIEFLERPGLALSTKETYSLTLGLLLQDMQAVQLKFLVVKH